MVSYKNTNACICCFNVQKAWFYRFNSRLGNKVYVGLRHANFRWEKSRPSDQG